MAIEYSLDIRDGDLSDNRVRDLLLEACPEFRILEEHGDTVVFDLESDLLFAWGGYAQDEFRDLGGHSFKTNAMVWFRHKKHDLHNADLQMLECVLYLLDHMLNDMVLTWQGETAILARVAGEIMLRDGDDFWTVPECLAMLEGRPYRVARMTL